MERFESSRSLKGGCLGTCECGLVDVVAIPGGFYGGTEVTMWRSTAI
jgi:hypothetical protein